MNVMKKTKTALAGLLSGTLLLSAFAGTGAVSAETESADDASGSQAETTYFKAYPKADYETISPDYTVTVNGQPIDTVAYFEYKNDTYRYSYAHLAYEGTAEFSIKNLHGEITEYNLSPHSYGIEATLSGDTLSFSLEQKDSRYLVLRTYVDDVRYELIVACDPKIDYGLEKLKEGNFVNVVEDLGFDNTGKTKLSRNNNGKAAGVLQDAINKLSDEGGGTLYFPKGTYSFVYLDARDQVTIYLDEGAYLYGTGDRTDYQWNATGANGRQGRRLINLGNARDFALIGPGTIDGNIIALSYNTKTTQTPAGGSTVPKGAPPAGWYPDGWNDFRTGLIDADGARNITIKGVTVKETTGWTFNICNSLNVDITNVKMLNDYEIVHSDGYDLVTCQKVTIDDCLGVCGDDVFCPKAADGSRVMKDYLITDGVAYAAGGAGCKIGVQSNARTENIVFDNIDVVQGYRAFCIAHDEGTGAWSNITFRNIRTEEIWIEGEPDSDGQYRPAAFILWTLGGGQGKVNKVTVENCSIEDTKGLRGIIQGDSAAGQLSNITIKNLTIDGMTINGANYRSKIDVGSNVTKLSFENEKLSLTDTVRYEAEISRDRTGSADAIKAEGASSGWVMGNLNKDSSVTLNVFAETAGEREIEIFYCTRGVRKLDVSVNNKAAETFNCKGTSVTETSEDTIKMTTYLKRGMNTITFSAGTNAGAPNLDKIEVASLTIAEKEAVAATVAAIDALPESANASSDNAEAVSAAINQYNELIDIQKVFVSNIVKLYTVNDKLVKDEVSLPVLNAIAPNGGELPDLSVKESPKAGGKMGKGLVVGLSVGAVAVAGAAVAVVLGKKKSKKKDK